MSDVENLAIKWKHLVDACKAYYIDSSPTGLSDAEYDMLESRAALEDGFFVRDYIFQKYLKGAKTKNSWIEKIKKVKVTGKTMLEAIAEVDSSNPGNYYYDLKYDGSSLAIYLDPTTGTPLRIVTVGNLNLDNYGVDQSWKLISFLPKRFPKGIVAIQAEALIDTRRLPEMPEKARQKANGLINSKYAEAEVKNLLTIKAYRYYTDDSEEGQKIAQMDYRSVLKSFPTIKSLLDGHILFSPADTWTYKELLAKDKDYTETDMTKTSTGTYLNDGWVVYSKTGICQGALKYAGAGESTEAIKTTVKGIQWNSQVPKGKDSWSANILIDPVVIKGCTIRKPSAGSVGKMVKSNITPGAEIGIILANSTIPMCGEVFSPGNGDFMWPTCSCGYTMDSKDVFGSTLKCGNQMCTERIERMSDYLETLENVHDELNLNTFLVIDRFKWETTGVIMSELLSYIEANDSVGYFNYLDSFLGTDLQKRNFQLIWKASFVTLKGLYDSL